jgi:hypothetical protein
VARLVYPKAVVHAVAIMRLSAYRWLAASEAF